MGRGLSDLQQKILALGVEENKKHNRGEPPNQILDRFDISITSAVVSFYGEKGKYGWDWPEGPALNAARVAVSRALVRLEARGLVARMKMCHAREAGANLTPEGWRYVQEMMPAAWGEIENRVQEHKENLARSAALMARTG